MPRVAKRQRYRSNTSNAVNCSCETDGCMHQVEQYFLLNSAIPFLDRIIVELESRFNGNYIKVLILLLAFCSTITWRLHDFIAKNKNV